MPSGMAKRTKRRVKTQYASFGRAVLDLAVSTDVGLSQETILREATRHGIVIRDESHFAINKGGHYDH